MKYEPQLNTWYHSVGVYDNGTARFYINGILQGEITDVSFSNQQLSVVIGRIYSSQNAYYFPGVIDDIRIYNCALSEPEILELFDALYDSTNYAGGSHGGPGDANSGSNANPCYGSTYYPSDAGSKGGTIPGSSSYSGGKGGGAIRITVGGILTLDGSIVANGEVSPSHGGGGSGGSIWIDANVITGSGSIEATGGSALDVGCGGGGGRIALYYNNLSAPFDQNQIHVYGGQGSGSNYPSGGAGTLYLKDNAFPYGDLIVDNETITNAARPTVLTLTGIGPGNNTDISGNQLTDLYAGYPLPDPNTGKRGFIGLWVNPDVLQKNTYLIIENTNNSLITDLSDGDMTQVAQTGSHYIGAYVFQDIILKGADLSCQDYLDIKGEISATDGELHIKEDYYLDLIPPAPPYVYPIPSPALDQTITIKGIKDAGNKVYLGYQCIVGATPAIIWQITYTLQEGKNTLSFTQKDNGGNHSIPIVKTVVYDEIPPLEVFPTADGRGDGTTITLAWQDYKEVSDLGY